MSRFFSAALALFFVAGSAFSQPDPALTRAPQGVALEEEARVGPALRSGGEADLTWRWMGEPRWLEGRSIDGGEAFFGSILRGRYFFGSTVGPDGDVPVEIVFSSSETTLAQTFRRDLSYAAAGVGTFPGAAYDVSDPGNPRRLNVAFVEDAGQAAPNLTWDPNASSGGGREYVFIMASDYDGTGLTYAGVNIFSDAASLDVLHFWWPRLRSGYGFLESDPATLSVGLAFITGLTATPGNGEVDLTWAYDPPAEAVELVVFQGTVSDAGEQIATLPPTQTAYFVDGLDPDTEFVFRIEAHDAGGEVIDVSTEVRTTPSVSENMTLLANLDIRSDYADIWGYVDTDTGREYAVQALRSSGLSIIDVTDDVPVEVGFVPGISDSKDVKTYGTYAYVVNEYAPIQIIDLSDPTSPAQVALLDVQPSTSDGGSHNILIDGDYLYVIGGRSPGGLRIYSLADPTAPAFVSDFQPTYYHDIHIDGDVLYAAAIYNEGVDVLDISDKTNPTFVSNFTYAASSYMGAHNVCGAPGSDYVFVGDEIGSEPHTRVFDVSDLGNVEQVADIITTPGQPVHNCYVKDDLLYIAHYADGARVFDVSDPASPVEIAFYDTYLGPGGGFEGLWTFYPFLPSGKLLGSDRQTGLYVLRLDNPPVANEDGAAPTRGATLGQSYPNPFAHTATIPFSLGEDAHVRLTVHDVLGREIAVLTDQVWTAGDHDVTFDGRVLPSGAYFYRLEADGLGAAVTHPFTLVR